MWASLRAEDPARISLYLAEHEGTCHAATIAVRVNRHVWYSYGASTTAGRDLRPSNAIQWQMIRDARDTGADTYDMRGITDTLDPDDHLFGLLQFKVGTGGFAQEYVGEWDYAIRPGAEPGLRGLHAPSLRPAPGSQPAPQDPVREHPAHQQHDHEQHGTSRTRRTGRT